MQRELFPENPIVQLVARLGLDVSRASRLLVERGVYRTVRDAERAMEIAREQVDKFGAGRFVRFDARPGAETLAPTAKNIGARFQFVSEIELENIETGERVTKLASINSDLLLTRRQIEEATEESVAEKSDIRGFRITRVQFQQGLVSLRRV